MPASQTSARHVLFVVLFFSILFTIFFSPVIFSGFLLAPGGGRLGDAVVYHLTFFESSKLLWDNLLANGFPMTADPQVMAWYPPALLLSFIPGAWNVFVVSAYVMASSFTYGYVYTITSSRLSGTVAGLTYGMCGFMMAHLGHTAMLHTAVWLPLIVWSLERLSSRITRTWLTIGCVAVACCVLAGHLQIVTYTLLLGSAYGAVVGWRAGSGRARFYFAALCLFILGVGLAALQITPAAELASLSIRVDYSYAEFVTYSLAAKHLLLMVFPAVFGGLPRYGGIPYFGDWNLTEMAGYTGLLPWLLAAIGFVTARRNRLAIFWLAAAVVTVLLALGDQTPLAHIAYYLPVIGKFRAPARHVLEVSFAVSVLAGFGVNAISQKLASKRLILLTVLGGLVLIVLSLVIVAFRLGQYAQLKGVVGLTTKPWSNPAIAVPIFIFLAAAFVLLYWYKSPSSPGRAVALVTILVLDLASFGWFYNWHDFAAPKDVVASPAHAVRYREQLRETQQRMLSVRGTLGTPSEFPPNLSRLSGLPNATGYSPLTLGRTNDLLTLLPDASLDPRWMDVNDQGVNLSAARYIFLPRAETMVDSSGVHWAAENMDIWLGSACANASVKSVKFKVPAKVVTNRIGVSSRLACSSGVPNGVEVARVLVTDSAGVVQTKSLIAGRDTAEWAYDCPTVKPQMKHDRATVFSNFPAKMYEDTCEGHFYRAFVGLDAGSEVSQIEIQWTGGSGAITLEKLSLINDETRSSVTLDRFSKEDSPWSFVEEAGEARVFENPRALPRAWIVGQVITLRPEEVLKSVKTSRLPDGRVYDPQQMALIEEPLGIQPASSVKASASVDVVSNRSMEIRTSSDASVFLVTSDSYYPGWSATVDGAPTQIFRANYALRGIQLPAGQHVVGFEYRPKSFYYGLTASSLSLLILAGLLMFWSKFDRSGSRDFSTS